MRRSNWHVCAWKNPPMQRYRKRKEQKDPNQNVFHLLFAPGCFFPLVCDVLHLQGLKDFSFLCCSFVSRGFGTVFTAVETATGEEVSVKQCPSFCSSRVPSPLLSAVAELWVVSRALLQRQMKCRAVSACQIKKRYILLYSAASRDAEASWCISEEDTLAGS